MSVPLTYGLLAQAMIAASIVRLALDLLPRRDGARTNGSEASAPGGRSPSSGSARAGSDIPWGTAWAVMAGPLVLLVPVGGCTIAEHMRGVWGDPSAVTCAILAMFIARPGQLPDRPSRLLCIGITLLVTVPLYGPVFGLRLPMPDLYALGWQPHPLLVVIAVAALLMRLSGRWCGTWSTIVAVALLAYAAGAMESSNVIDYLADPGLLIALAVMGAIPRPGRPRSAAQGQSAHG